VNVVLRLLVVLAIGCGGGSTRSSAVNGLPPSVSGPVDIPAMRALLDRYSPTGSWVVNSDDTLPHEFAVGGSKISLSSSDNFATWFKDGNPDELVDQMNTAVHEGFHKISSRLGYTLLLETKPPALTKVQGVYAGGNPTYVEVGPTYPSREMAATFPQDAITVRFATYVSPSQDNHATQVEGVFGLLDEWTAYMNGGRTTLDFWPWVRDEAPHTGDLYVLYRSRFYGLWLQYAEFKLFILHYLVHAQTNKPDVYRALVSNASFRRAFTAVDDAWTTLLADAKALERAVVSIEAERGAANTIWGSDAGYPGVMRVLATEPYQRALAELRR